MIVNDLHLSIFPRLIEYFEIQNSYYIITKVPNNTGKNMRECSDYFMGKVSGSVKQQAFLDVGKLEAGGYGVILNDNIKINNDGLFMIPWFDLLTREERKEIYPEATERFDYFCKWLRSDS